MAGMISVGGGRTWSSAGWLFDWVLRTLSAEVDDTQLRADLVEIERENIGYFDVSAYSSESQSKIRHALATRLVPLAEGELQTVPSLRAALTTLQELADLSASTS